MLATELGAPYLYVISESLLGPVRELLGLAAAGGGTTSVALGARGVAGPGLAALKGIGKEIWKGEDAQEYVNRLRKEWR